MKIYSVKSSRLTEKELESFETVHGSVSSVRALQSAWRLGEVEKIRGSRVESDESGDFVNDPSQRSEQDERSESMGEALSLGYDTYLDTAVETPENSMVAEICKSPIHRWKRKKQARGVRGKVVGFSASSRQRLMVRVASVAKGVPCHFVSLTFPMDLSAQDAKNHLWALWRRFERHKNWRNKRIGMVWKLEPQKSGRWHFHLMVYGCKFIPHTWLKVAWTKILGTENVRGAYHRGVDVKWVDGDLSAVQAYVSKYFGKEVEAASYGDLCGRVWGCRGDLPIGEIVRIGLTVRELTWLWRIISRKRKTNVVKMNRNLLSNCPVSWVENAKILAERQKMVSTAIDFQ